VRQKTRTVTSVLAGILACSPVMIGKTKNVERLDEAATVIQEIMDTPDKGIPQDLMDKANCVVVIPGMKKGAFIVGAQYGKGYATCRQRGVRGWSAPATVRVEGGSVGFQIGGTETDVILLVMNKSGADSLMKSKFTLGGEAQAAAGPVGRSTTADTDAAMRAEILSYSRARGVFAGISLKGATMREDLDSNKAMYGQRLTTAEIVRDHKVKPTTTGAKFVATIEKYSPKELSD
jgi:SH3 domain-containing YSC84-like protein 1